MYLSHDDNHNEIALKKYEAMLKSNRIYFFDSNEFENIIHYYLDNGKVNKAKKAITTSLSQHPDAINLKLLKVEILVFDDELNKAEALLSKIQAIEPENEEVFIQRASILSKRDNHKQAITLLKKALEYSVDKADIHSLLGMEYLFLDDFENAKIHFSNCLLLDPDDYSSLYNTINCFIFLEQTEKAIEFLNDYLNINPYCEVAWHQLGLQYNELKEYKKALTAFDFAIISDDRFVGAYIEKAKVLEKLKRYQEAIENYSLTLELEDPTSYALLHIGKCFEKLKNKEKALYYYNKTVNEDPLLDKGWIAITDYYYAEKNYQKALHYTNKAIDIDSENFAYWERYAKINKRLSFFEEAERGFFKTIELGNHKLDIWLERADLLFLLGEIDASIFCLEHAMELYPENAELTYRMAGLLFTKNETEKGNYHLKNALKNDVEYFLIIEELFPKVAKLKKIQNILSKYKK